MRSTNSASTRAASRTAVAAADACKQREPRPSASATVTLLLSTAGANMVRADHIVMLQSGVGTRKGDGVCHRVVC